MPEEIDIFNLLNKKTTIYHYTTSTVALENILPFGKLRLTPLALTNDPLEYKELLLVSGGWGDFVDPENKITEAMLKVDQIRREKYQMISFSLNQKDQIPEHSHPLVDPYELLGCCKPRMWSQYGENQRGVVIALNQDKLTGGADNKLIKEKRIHGKSIVYKAIKIKSELSLNSNEILANNVEGYCENFINSNLDTLFFYKNPDYHDEDEYRIIVNPLSDNRVLIDIKEALIAVIIGDRFPDGLLPSLKFLCKKLNIPCKRVWWDSGQPFLFDCLPLDPCLQKTWEDL